MKSQSLFLSILSFVSTCWADLDAPRYPQNVGNWTGWGGNTYNNRWAITNDYFTSETLPNIVQHCQIEFTYGLSATPTIAGDVTYFPTWNGEFVAVNYKTCDILWSINVTEIVSNFSPITAFQLYCHQPVSRTSPQVDSENGIVYFGTQMFALLVAADLSTGDVLGTYQINDHIVAQISMSPTLYEGIIYVGAASEEEMAITYGTGTSYQCCDFIGNFGAFKFDLATKQWTQLWNVNMIGDSKTLGFAGAAVWGSQPSIDSARNQVFFGTGNLYGTLPAAYQDCLTAACMPADLWFDSILAVDIVTGNVNWVKQMSPLDAWSFACVNPYKAVSGAIDCPNGPGPDADFAMAPTFVPAALGPNVNTKDSVIVGKKDGYLYSLAAVDGTVNWGTDVAAPDNKGGLAWGIAVDDTEAYFVATNYGNNTWALVDGDTITNGAFGAINQQTGAVNWQVPIPNLQISAVSPTVIGDVVITGSQGAEVGYIPGSLIALNKNTGDILMTTQLDVVFHGGISFANEYMLVGTGYRGDNVSFSSR